MRAEKSEICKNVANNVRRQKNKTQKPPKHPSPSPSRKLVPFSVRQSVDTRHRSLLPSLSRFVLSFVFRSRSRGGDSLRTGAAGGDDGVEYEYAEVVDGAADRAFLSLGGLPPLLLVRSRAANAPACEYSPGRSSSSYPSSSSAPTPRAKGVCGRRGLGRRRARGGEGGVCDGDCGCG